MDKWTELEIFSTLVQIINTQFGTETTPTTNLRFSTYYGATKKDMSHILKQVQDTFGISVSKPESDKIVTINDMNNLIKEKVAENNQLRTEQLWRKIPYRINAPKISKTNVDIANTEMDRFLEENSTTYCSYNSESLDSELKVSGMISYSNFKSNRGK